MEGKKIALIANSFSINGGASKAIKECANSLMNRGYDVHILCSKSSYKKLPDGVCVVCSDDELKKSLIEIDVNIVIFFKAAKSLVQKSILNRFVSIKAELKNDVKVITVVCQQPSNPETILTPFEIKNSNHLIFIDKTAYNDPLYYFIPEEKKTWTYLSIPDIAPNPLDQYVKTDYTLKNGEVVFGRGSSFGKCPRNMLEPFEKLSVNFNKKFIIVGVPQGLNWLSRAIKRKKMKNVVTYPLMGFAEWMQLVNTFDIGLYCLPKNAHSSIDGTLGQMMRIGLPVIVGGAPAPKERIVHGVNGFIADTVPEMIHYAEMLANDQTLREKIGKNARQSTLDLNSKSWIDKLERIIKDIFCSNEEIEVSIPLPAKLKINTIYVVSLIEAWMVRPVYKILNKK